MLIKRHHKLAECLVWVERCNVCVTCPSAVLSRNDKTILRDFGMTITVTSGRGRNGRDAADCDKLALKYRGRRLAAGVRRERHGWLAELMDSYYAVLIKEDATLGLCSSMVVVESC